MGITNNLWDTQINNSAHDANVTPWGIPVIYWGMPILLRNAAGQAQNVALGNALPDFRFAVTNDVRYKRFNFYALVDAAVGQKVWNQGFHWAHLDFLSHDVDQAGKAVENAKPIGYYWRTGPADGFTGMGGFYDQLAPNSYTVEDASYAKLRELLVSYHIGPIARTGDWEVAVVGRNLWTITGYRGFDPEVGLSGGQALNNSGSAAINAVDAFTFPNLRTFTFGLSSRSAGSPRRGTSGAARRRAQCPTVENKRCQVSVCSGGLFLMGILACGDALVVEDFNDPDRNRALGRPADVEAFISNTYAQIQNATLGGSNDDLQTQLQVMGMENTSALANFAMGPRGAIPRTPIENTRNSTGDVGNNRDFVVLHRAARMATIGISAMNKLGTLGSAAQDARARSFARFVEGVAYGNLALAYDSASILSETDDPQAIIPLSYYTDVIAAAYTMLDSAITIARANPGSFPIPSTWMNGQATGVSLDTTAYFRLIHSYKARFRASVARTPAERAAADWAAIIADANAGITADFNIAMNPTAGWDVIWPVQAYATGPANWHQMSQFWLGMADSSGGYDAWLNTAASLRTPFIVVSADRRFPRGTSCFAPCPLAIRTSQIPDSNRSFTGVPYVRNRQPGEDQPGNPLQISMYDFYRSRNFTAASRTGPYPVMTRAEIRLYAAEGYIRTGNFAAATARIDSSRVTIGLLPSVAALADTLAAIPGGVACVPRIPDAAAAFKASKCGTLWDAMKWEYRMETAYTGYGMWYFAARGWGDLPEGTSLYWPVPYQEMDTRRQAFYSAGGPNLPGGAPRGNYGLYAGGVY